MQEVAFRSPTADDIDAVVDLTGRSFGEYWLWREYALQGYYNNSAYDFDASSIGAVGSALVSHVGTWRYRLRYGAAAPMIAGVGAVTTHAEYRKRGIMRRAFVDALDRQNAAGYDITLLFGIRNFYEQFGFAPLWPDDDWTIGIDDLAHVKGIEGVDLSRIDGIPRSPASPHGATFDPITFAEVYNRHHETVDGTAIRPTYRTVRRRPWRTVTLRDAGDALVAYVVINDDREGGFYVADFAGESPVVFAMLRRFMETHTVERVRFPSISPNEPLAAELRRIGGRLERAYRRTGGPMGRIVSLSRAMETMRPELTRRLDGSGYRNTDGDLSIDDGRERVACRVRHGIVVECSAAGGDAAEAGERATVGAAAAGGNAGVGTVAPWAISIAGGAELVRLVMGTSSVHELVGDGCVELTGPADLASVLFPQLDPRLPPWDHV